MIQKPEPDQPNTNSAATTPDSDQPIVFAGVLLAHNRLLQIDFVTLARGRSGSKIARQGVRRIVVRHGVLASHPHARLLAGILICGLGLVGIAMTVDILDLVNWVHTISLQQLPKVLMGPMCLMIGVLMISTAYGRGYYLFVERAGRAKRLAFSRRLDVEKLRQFAAEIEKRWGVRVDWEIA